LLIAHIGIVILTSYLLRGFLFLGAFVHIDSTALYQLSYGPLQRMHNLNIDI
jgi:hypothetical protein